MYQLIAKLGRTSLLLALFVGLLAAAPGSSAGAKPKPQCSDGIDNDGDNAIDGVDAGCLGGDDNDEADSPYTKIITVTIALPVVNIQGTVTPKGVVKVSQFRINALRGSLVRITCTGKHCPFKSFRRRMITSTLRVSKLEGNLRPAMTLKLRIKRPGELGKYMRYVVRKKKAPVRTDRCLDGVTGNVVGCFTG
jgi:hypothetical protein